MLPPPSIAFREVPKGGDMLSGLFVPEGTWVGFDVLGLMMDPALFGADAKMFRPERWLSGDRERVRKMEMDFDLIFSYGKSACLGKNIALMELNKVIVEVCKILPASSFKKTIRTTLADRN